MVLEATWVLLSTSKKCKMSQSHCTSETQLKDIELTNWRQLGHTKEPKGDAGMSDGRKESAVGKVEWSVSSRGGTEISPKRNTTHDATWGTIWSQRADEREKANKKPHKHGQKRATYRHILKEREFRRRNQNWDMRDHKEDYVQVNGKPSKGLRTKIRRDCIVMKLLLGDWYEQRYFT